MTVPPKNNIMPPVKQPIGVGRCTIIFFLIIEEFSKKGSNLHVKNDLSEENGDFVKYADVWVSRKSMQFTMIKKNMNIQRILYRKF